MGLFDMLIPQNKAALDKDEIAELLGTTPGGLAAFEASYKKHVLDNEWDDGSFFNISAKQTKDTLAQSEGTSEGDSLLIERIVQELLAQTSVMVYDGESLSCTPHRRLLPESSMVTKKDIAQLPIPVRPQLSGDLMHVQCDAEASSELMANYRMYLRARDLKRKAFAYKLFRQGLDIVDLDPLVYAMLGTNPNAMGYWLPNLVQAVKKQKFFKVPKTKVMRVPMTMLQMSRIDFDALTPATKQIVDKVCFDAFDLDEEKDYFVKTGTFSSKFDFRNAHVHGAKEVRELGEYLLFISNMAVQMAGPLSQPSIYGVSTTNEWVVREYIHDPETDPCIYKGMPLRTEYRVFVDFDANEILGISPYWEPETMKKRFSRGKDASSPHQIHDYVIFKAHEDRLMERYDAHKDEIMGQLQSMLPDFEMTGQWSIDVMQSGSDFYIIDMALAANSALSECVPKGKLRPVEENWLPRISE